MTISLVLVWVLMAFNAFLALYQWKTITDLKAATSIALETVLTYEQELRKLGVNVNDEEGGSGDSNYSSRFNPSTGNGGDSRDTGLHSV